MKYEQQIADAFKRLGFKPREGQMDAVNQILLAFVDEKMVNVILNASTGTGKSIIGAATAEALTALRGGHDGAIKSSISLTATNVLAKQYDTTFHGLGDRGKYIMLKGAGNYGCSALSTPSEEVAADACAWWTMVQSGSEFEDIMAKHCNKCEFLDIKRKKNLTRHLTTNYSYFFIDRMYTGKFEDRDLLIWDEAHLINDLFSEHNAIFFSQKRMLAIQKEIAETVHLTDVEVAKTISAIAADCAKVGKINEKNYKTYLNALVAVYSYAKEQGTILSDRALRSGHMSQYSKLSRFTKKFEGLLCKIDDLYKYDYPHVFEYKEEEQAVSVKPVFVGTMIEALQAASHNLFMSATVSEAFITKTMTLDKEKTKFIKLDPTFPKENKEIVFFDTMSLGYQSLQQPEVVKQLRKNVAKIVKHHIDQGERGIVLTPSFKLQNEIVAELTSASWAKSYKLFEQRQGEKLEHTLTAFKAYKGGPALLISPSIFEGVDLPGDMSRFQVMVKAPFPSLGDKRIKFILDHHPDLYNTITIMKAVQGAGRSVRSSSDHAVTYCLDQNLARLWSSPLNVWKNEFNTRFTKFL
jgi:Rad3-related DNA helicase